MEIKFIIDSFKSFKKSALLADEDIISFSISIVNTKFIIDSFKF